MYVMRAASSKGAADLIALWPPSTERRTTTTAPYGTYTAPGSRLCGVTWLVQCKRDGRLPRAEREELIRIAAETGAIPILAKTGKNGRGVEFMSLNDKESK